MKDSKVSFDGFIVSLVQNLNILQVFKDESEFKKKKKNGSRSL